MDAQRAFERFEKSGAGLAPVFLLALLTISATIGAIHLHARVPRIAVELTELTLDIGHQLARSVGYSEKYQKVSDETPGPDESVRHEKIEKAFADPQYVAMGTFRLIHFSASQFQFFIDSENRFMAGAAWDGTDASLPIVAFASFTEDHREIHTVSQYVPSFDPPSVKKQVVSTKGTLPEVVAQLREAHLQRIASETIQPIREENFLSMLDQQAERTAIWLIEQAPIDSQTVSQSLGELWVVKNKLANALLLMGFCDRASDDYDRVAIEAFRAKAGHKQPPPANQLLVLHGMSNELHIARLLPEAIDRETIALRLQSEWLPRTAAAGRTDPKQVEQLMHELTSADPLVQIGEIEQPFRARVFQRTSQATGVSQQ